MTPEQRSDHGYRILAAIPRAPRGVALDNAAAEIGMLIGTLCKTAEAADALTEHLVTRPWIRWSFAEVRAAAMEFCKAPAPASAAIRPPTAAEDWGLPPDEFAALTARAKRAGHDFYAEYEAAHDEAERLVDALPAAKITKLMEVCRADFTSYMRDPANNVGHLHGRSMEPPFLDRNARDIAIARMYLHLLFRRPLLDQWPTWRANKTNPRPASKVNRGTGGLKHL
jgi:hypothetical protein